MKHSNLLTASGLVLALAGCPGDDSTPLGPDASSDTGTAGTMSSSGGSDDTAEPTGDGTTGDDTTGNDTTGDDTSTGEPPEVCKPPGEPAPSFDADVWPIIEANCHGVLGCHNMSAGGLDMTDAAAAYANLVDVPSGQSPLDRIQPGSPDDSYVWAKLNGMQLMVGGIGSQMPQGSAPLPQEDLDTIQSWILGCAPQ
ncbi:MAG: hypothetical protein KDK70_17680 [Myxococcales bacterium]|nr:hypothetical protein [Myxococcales bacterium]